MKQKTWRNIFLTIPCLALPIALFFAPSALAVSVNGGGGIPFIISTTPDQQVTSPPFTFIVDGGNFINGSTIQFNGISYGTTFISNTQLQLDFLLDPGTMGPGMFSITVTNPESSPGAGDGGTSNTTSFNVLDSTGGGSGGFCGDGIYDSNNNEQCDDGNNFNGDGCNTACQCEPGWDCASDSPIKMGCTDPAADNYDPTAGSEDGSCTYGGGGGSGGSGPATINIIKYTNIGAPAQTFTFDFGEGSGSTPTESFIAVDATTPLGPGGYTGTASFGVEGTAGYYELEENLPTPEWTVDSIYCYYGDNTPAGGGEGTFVGFNVLPGQTVTCEFRNTYTAPAAGGGTLQIIKNTEGGPGGVVAFDFMTNGTPLLSMAIDTSNTFGSGTSSRPISSGRYSVTENMPGGSTGWTLENAFCDNGDPINDVGIAAGQTVTCTFNNKFGGGGGGGGGAICGNGVVEPANNEMCDDGNLNNGDGCSSVCQTEPGGGGGGGTLFIQKITSGNDGTFQFSVMPTPLLFSITTTGYAATGVGGGQTGPIPLNTGSYSITETPDPQWRVANLVNGSGFSCNKRNPGDIFFINGTNELGGTFTIADGLETWCSITNEWISKFRVEKTTIGGDGIFNIGFSPGGGFIGSTNIATSGGFAAQEFDAPVGTWNVGESLPTGGNWALTSQECFLQDGTPTGGTPILSGGGGSIPNVEFKAGQTTTCRFTNTKTGTPPPTTTGTLRLEKKTYLAGGTFTFQSNAGFPSLSMTADASNLYNPFMLATVSTALTAPAPYITETLQPGWELDSAFCDFPYELEYDDDGNLIGVKNITVNTNTTTTCYFNNTFVGGGGLVINKNTIGGDDTFQFMLSSGTFSSSASLNTSSGTGTTGIVPGLPAGNYNITESLPPDWALDEASCTMTGYSGTIGSPITGGIENVIVSDAALTVCTFTNSKTAPPTGLGTLVIKKRSFGADGNFNFTVNGWPLSLTTSGSSGSTPGIGSTSINLTPGNSYIVAEIPATSWTLTKAQCTDPTNPSAPPFNLTGQPITLVAGQTTTCTFENSMEMLCF